MEEYNEWKYNNFKRKRNSYPQPLNNNHINSTITQKQREEAIKL